MDWQFRESGYRSALARPASWFRLRQGSHLTAGQGRDHVGLAGSREGLTTMVSYRGPGLRVSTCLGPGAGKQHQGYYAEPNGFPGGHSSLDVYVNTCPSGKWWCHLLGCRLSLKRASPQPIDPEIHKKIPRVSRVFWAVRTGVSVRNC